MTVRERNLFLALLAVAGLVGGAIAVMHWFWTPVQEAQRKLADLATEVADKEKQITDLRAEQKRLAKYKALSLPANPYQAASDYQQFLQEVLRKAGLSVDNLEGPPAGTLKMPPAQGKKAAHLILAFSVRARGDIAGVVQTLAALKATPLAHRVKGLTLQPADGSGKDTVKLNIQMTIEALIVNKAAPVNPVLDAPDTRLVFLESIAALRRAPLGLAVGPWFAAREAIAALVDDDDTPQRNYLTIAGRNPFMEAVPIAVVQKKPEPFDIREYIKLDHTVPTTNEAFLRNYAYRERETKLRPKKNSGYEYFVVWNEDRSRQLMKGKALRVDQRDVYFQVIEDIYRIRIGSSLAEAMRRPLSSDELEELQLTSLYDDEFAKAEMAKKGPAKGPTKGGKTPKKRM